MVIMIKSLALICMGIIFSQVAIAEAMTSKEMLKLENVVFYEELSEGTDKSTDWRATPVMVVSENAKTKKPEIIFLYIESEGYRGAFANSVQINCVKPTQSFIKANNDKNISLKTSMAFEADPWNDNFQYRMGRNVVEGLFAKFCK